MHGRRFGMLVVREQAESNEAGDAMWLLDCDCGGTRTMKGSSLRIRKGNLRADCGCSATINNLTQIGKRGPKAADLIGQVFGRLTVTELVGKDLAGNYFWGAACSCGGSHPGVATKMLRNGNTKSCGCLVDEARRAPKDWRQEGLIGPKLPWPPKVKNLLDKRFGQLTVIEYDAEASEASKSGTAHWVCLCDCGQRKTWPGNTLQSKENTAKNCGDQVRHPRGLPENLDAAVWRETEPSATCHLGREVNAEGYAHYRRVYEAMVRKLNSGEHLDHLCRVRRCCSTAHLEPVTRKENLRRKKAAHAMIAEAGRNLTADEWLAVDWSV